ncbi:MAG: hypothetical protein KBB39_01385 [Phycicoccus sp.]|nr:hypothetical protein [Phycicoccus sp.]
MGKFGGQRADGGPGLLRRLIDRPLSHLLYALLAVVLLVSAPLGGLRTAQSTEPSEFTTGAWRAVAPYEIAITKVLLTQAPGGDIPELEGTAAYLMVGGRLRNPLEQAPWVAPLDPQVTLVDVPGLARDPYSPSPATADHPAVPAVYVVQDGHLLGAPGPGLSYDVAFAFKVEDQAAIGATVTVETRALTYRENFVEGGFWWADGTPNGRIILPVTRPAASSPTPAS